MTDLQTQLHHCCLSNGDYGEKVDFAYWLRCIVEGSVGSLKSRIVFAPDPFVLDYLFVKILFKATLLFN